MKKLYVPVLAAVLLTTVESKALTVFNASFASPSSSSWTEGAGVQINTSLWSVYENANFGARISGGRLEINSRIGQSAHGQGFAYVPCGGVGSVYDAFYNPVLASNTGLVTWTFNMRKSPTTETTTGFSCTSASLQNGRTIGLGYVLGSSSHSGILSSTGNCNQNGTADGYAVLHGGTNTIRLVRFDNGINNGALTTIATSQTVTYANYHSVRVTYDPATNAWTLQVRSDGASSFADPAQGTYPSTANGVDGTYTNISLDFTGGYFQAGCTGNCDEASAGYIASFDNVNVDVFCAQLPAPGPIVGDTVLCQSVAGTYTITAVTGATSYVWSYSGTGVTVVPNGTDAELTFGPTATSGTLSVVAVLDCPGIPRTLAIQVQPLPTAPGALTGPILVCEGSVNNYSVADVPSETYEWTYPSNWTGPMAGASVDLTAGNASGAVSVIGTNSCGVGPTTVFNVVVNPAPVVTMPAFGLVCATHPPFQFTGGSPAGGEYTFNGVPATSFNPAVGVGTYTIGYTYTDAASGCAGTATQPLVVDACIGISENEMAGLRIYPNPVIDGQLFFEAPVAGDITLFDAAGRVVDRVRYAAGAGRLGMDVSGRAAGVHVLEFSTTKGRKSRTLVVIGE